MDNLITDPRSRSDNPSESVAPREVVLVHVRVQHPVHSESAAAREGKQPIERAREHPTARRVVVEHRIHHHGIATVPIEHDVAQRVEHGLIERFDFQLAASEDAHSIDGAYVLTAIDHHWEAGEPYWSKVTAQPVAHPVWFEASSVTAS